MHGFDNATILYYVINYIYYPQGYGYSSKTLQSAYLERV